MAALAIAVALNVFALGVLGISGAFAGTGENASVVTAEMGYNGVSPAEMGYN